MPRQWLQSKLFQKKQNILNLVLNKSHPVHISPNLFFSFPPPAPHPLVSWCKSPTVGKTLLKPLPGPRRICTWPPTRSSLGICGGVAVKISRWGESERWPPVGFVTFPVVTGSQLFSHFSASSFPGLHTSVQMTGKELSHTWRDFRREWTVREVAITWHLKKQDKEWGRLLRGRVSRCDLFSKVSHTTCNK